MRTLKQDEVILVAGGSDYVIENAPPDDSFMGSVLSGLRWFTGLISGSSTESMTVGSSYFIRG